MEKRITVLGVLIVALVVLSAGAGEKRFTVPVGDSPSLGPANAPVLIIEFIDFQ